MGSPKTRNSTEIRSKFTFFDQKLGFSGTSKLSFGGGSKPQFSMLYNQFISGIFKGGGQKVTFWGGVKTLLIISVTGLPRAGVHGCSKPGPPAQLVLRAFLQFWGGGLVNSTTFPLELSQRPIQYRIAKNPVFFPLKTKNIKI